MNMSFEGIYPMYIRFSGTSSDLSNQRTYYCPTPIAAESYTFHIEVSQSYFGYDTCYCSQGYYGKYHHY